MPLLTVLLAPVVVYCLLRAVAPRWGGADAEHRRDLDAWHVLMSSAMTAMLLGVLSRSLAIAAVTVCAVALCWGVLSVERRRGAAHVRLVVGAAAMAVMTLPLAAPATAAADQAGDGAADQAGSSMPGMAAPSPVALVAVLVLGLLAVAAVRLPVVVRRTPGAVARLDAACDVVMAGAMAAMLIALL